MPLYHIDMTRDQVELLIAGQTLEIEDRDATSLRLCGEQMDPQALALVAAGYPEQLTHATDLLEIYLRD